MNVYSMTSLLWQLTDYIDPNSPGVSQSVSIRNTILQFTTGSTALSGNPVATTLQGAERVGPPRNDWGERIYYSEVKFQLLPTSEHAFRVKGILHWVLDLVFTFHDKNGGNTVETTKDEISSGLVYCPGAVVHIEQASPQPFEYNYYTVDTLRYKAIVNASDSVMVRFPAGTGHTPPGKTKEGRSSTDILATVVVSGNIQVVRRNWEHWIDQSDKINLDLDSWLQ